MASDSDLKKGQEYGVKDNTSLDLVPVQVNCVFNNTL